MNFLKTVRCFPFLVISYLIEFVIIPIRMFAFTQADENEYDFSEITESDRMILVTNNLGRTVLYGEFVYLGGYFGEVREFNGIANGATGYININPDRKIRTKQIETTDTFTVGNPLYFASGGSGAAGKLTDASGAPNVKVGTILEEEGTGGAQTSVTFRPFTQNKVGNGEAKILVYKVTTGAAAIVVPGLKAGDEILDVMIIPTGASTNGTMKLTNGTNDITDSLTCAVDKTMDRATTIDDAYSTLPAAGATIVCAGDTVANTKAIVVITYIPA